MKKYLQVVTTVPTRALADRLARTMVQGRLAACGQVSGPIQSTFRWRGRVENAREWCCVLKTNRQLMKALFAAIEAFHPYDTPEIIAFDITAGGRRYLSWLGRSVARKAE